jgi:hypothetical protein
MNNFIHPCRYDIFPCIRGIAGAFIAIWLSFSLQERAQNRLCRYCIGFPTKDCDVLPHIMYEVTFTSPRTFHIVCLAVCSGAHQRAPGRTTHQRNCLLASNETRGPAPGAVRACMYVCVRVVETKWDDNPSRIILMRNHHHHHHQRAAARQTTDDTVTVAVITVNFVNSMSNILTVRSPVKHR